MRDKLEDLTQALLKAAASAGADAADAMAVAGSSLTIDVRAGTLEQAERAEGTDIGLRVFLGHRQACVSASDTSSATIHALAERAVAMAQEAPEDPYVGLADPGQLSQQQECDALELSDPAAEPAPETLRENALEAETAAMSVAGVTQVQSATATYGHRAIHIAATNGFSGGYDRTDRGLYCSAIAGTGTGMERDHDGDSRIFQTDLRAAHDIGQEAGQRAVARLDARKPPTGTFPVLFDERISSSLIGHILAAANGAAVARGASWLRDKLEEQIMPLSLSITEDPLRARVAGSRPFDAEGLATQRRDIVKDGIFTGLTLDLATARKLNMAPTGNAMRGTSAPPSPGNWNIALSQGDRSREALLADMGEGLLITSLIGTTINPNTGDYSRGASGFWVERGEIAYPVNECTIAGALPEMLIRMVPGNDARPHLSRVVPSILIEGMAIAGA